MVIQPSFLNSYLLILSYPCIGAGPGCGWGMGLTGPGDGDGSGIVPGRFGCIGLVSRRGSGWLGFPGAG